LCKKINDMKNIFIKTLALIAIVVMAHNKINAQSSVIIADLAVMPMVPANSTAQDSIGLMVHFKINEPANAAKVHFWLGTANDTYNILSVTPVFSTTGNVTSLLFGGQSYVVKNSQVTFLVKISKADYANSFKATLYVETNSGQFTSKLYY
jgi:hypothetical protein